jgi:acyl carrier protein
VARQFDETAIREWCIAYLAKSLKRSAELINPEANFARLGVDSATSVIFLVDLEEWLNIELPAETVFQHPTINKLAQHVVTKSTADAARARQQS